MAADIFSVFGIFQLLRPNYILLDFFVKLIILWGVLIQVFHIIVIIRYEFAISFLKSHFSRWPPFFKYYLAKSIRVDPEKKYGKLNFSKDIL